MRRIIVAVATLVATTTALHAETVEGDEAGPRSFFPAWAAGVFRPPTFLGLISVAYRIVHHLRFDPIAGPGYATLEEFQGGGSRGRED